MKIRIGPSGGCHPIVFWSQRAQAKLYFLGGSRMGPFHFVFAGLAALAASAAAADSRCEYDEQLGQDICPVGPSPTTPPGGGGVDPGVSYTPSQLSVNYQGFMDVLRGFDGLAVAS